MNLTRGFFIANYRILERIGLGGMGEVWLAVAEGGRHDGKKVVVKTLLPDLGADKKFIEMFLREGRIAASLASPRVVAIEDLGRSGDTYYLVLEWVDGLSLLQLMSRYGGPLAPEVAAHIALRICEGLRDIHSAQGPGGEPLRIVHRDVSPGNTLISRRGEVKLSDFGIAKSSTSGAQTATTIGSIKGKFAYMSPEQARGEVVDERSDLWSAGVVLHQMLTGELPYRVHSDAELLAQVSSGVPLSLVAIDPHAPLPLARVLTRALQRDVTLRYPDADAMCRDLSAFLAGHEPDALKAELARLVSELVARRPAPAVPLLTPDTALPRPAPSRTRRRAGLALLAALALGLGAAWWAVHEEVPPLSPPAPEPTHPESVAPRAALALPAAPSEESLPAREAAPIEPSPEKPTLEVPTRAKKRPRPVLASGKQVAAAPSTRTLRVASVPRCEVRVGGHAFGLSPATVSFDGVPVRIQLFSRELGINFEQTLSPAEDQREVTIEVPRAELQIRVDPWAEVTLDGKALGVTPLPVVATYAGRHDLVFWNSELGTQRKLAVEVAPGELKVVRMQLE